MGNMKPQSILSLFALLSLLLGSASASETRILFNGKDLDGWEIVNDGQFSVEDGLLKLNRGTGWLRSEDTFSDYKLTMEFRFTEVGSNSGIFIRTAATSKEDESGWPDNGIQIQTIDSVEYIHPLGMIIPYGAPPFEFVSSREAATSVYKQAGNWHTYEIECVGEIIKVRLNGTLVGIAVGVKNAEGHVGIQGENGLLEFRKIEIEVL